MAFFAPNKYKIVDGSHVFSGEPDMNRIIEVSEETANQVLRLQNQWIEVVKPEERTVIYEVEVKSSPEVENIETKSPKAEVLKRGRPKKA